MKVTEKTKTLEKSLRELTMNLEMEKKQYTYVWRKCLLEFYSYSQTAEFTSFSKKSNSKGNSSCRKLDVNILTRSSKVNAISPEFIVTE